MSALLAAIAQLIALGVQLAPEIIAAAEQVLSLVKSGQAPSTEQQAQIDAALAAAHTALQNA